MLLTLNLLPWFFIEGAEHRNEPFDGVALKDPFGEEPGRGAGVNGQASNDEFVPDGSNVVYDCPFFYVGVKAHADFDPGRACPGGHANEGVVFHVPLSITVMVKGADFLCGEDVAMLDLVEIILSASHAYFCQFEEVLSAV